MNLDEQLKADAEAMMEILRARGRNPNWIQENYPNDYRTQCFILRELLADD